MTAGEAIERAGELRPGSRIAEITSKRWLREVDGMLRQRFFALSDTSERDEAGADVLWADDTLSDSAQLLVPAPFDSLYPHYLCAMTDAALGESERYANEQAQYNAILSELAAWLRRTYAPRASTRWRW